jgi:class 3 adenylate cyclase
MRFSIRSKIILVLLPLGLACLAVGGALGYRAGDQALTQNVERELTAQREMKRQRVEAYIHEQLRLTSVIASSPDIADASKDFIVALKEMRARPPDPAAAAADASALDSWYREHYITRLNKTSGSRLDVSTLLPPDPVARRLQVEFLRRDPKAAGEEDPVGIAPGDNPYARVHAQYHHRIKHLAEAVGFGDINLVDPAGGDILFSVNKEIDFLSNIYHSPFGRSSFAQIVERALDPRNAGEAVIQDYTAYPPSAFAPQLLTAVPVMTDGQPVAVVVAQIDVEALNRLLTDDGQWRQNGEGETGEVLLVGEDRLLRSQSRFLQEEPKKFLAELRDNGLPEATTREIETLDTTILYLPVNTDEIERAFHNQSGFGRFTDYRGAKVLGAYGPIEVAGLRWAITAKQDVAEAWAPVAALRRELLAAAAISTVAITLIALACASVFMRPIRRILSAMVSGRDGHTIARVPVTGSDEFTEVLKSYNVMVDAIDERERRVLALQQEKDDLVRRFYPQALAGRLCVGAETDAETISNVTVAVCFVDGIEPLGVELSAAEVRERLHTLFDVLLATAKEHGVEPVRSLGESYIAVCGLSSPRLDHAERTMAWTHSAALAVSRISAAWARSVTMRFGIASGDVMIFSTGHTPYDLWGRTLGVARLTALAADPNTARVDFTTHALLTEVEGLRPCPPIENAAWGSIVSWARPLSERPAAQAAE